MDADLYQQARQLFFELAELPPREARRILDGRDLPRAVREEVESLLEHRPQTDLDPRRGERETTQSPRNHRRLLNELFGESSQRDAILERLDDLSRQSVSDSLRGGPRKADGLNQSSAFDQVGTIDPRIGDLIVSEGRYSEIGRIGAGGMGTVYRVRDEMLQRDLAMKVLKRDVTGSSANCSATLSIAKRFVNEAQTTGRLAHPGVVSVHELGINSSGQIFFTMALIEGQTMKEIFARLHAKDPEWTVVRALGALLRACETLAYAHSSGVVHRDIKPSNIMIGSFGETYMMDWGLAKDRNQSPDQVEVYPSVHESQPNELQTLEGEVLGTPCYMPPEQAGGEIELIQPWSDVYSMGALLYHMLSGNPPYLDPGESVPSNTLVRRVLDGPPRPLSSSVDAELASICQKAMHRDPAQRYPDMQSMSNDVRAYLEGRVVRAHRRGPWIELKKWVQRNRRVAAAWATAVTLALLGLVGLLLMQANKTVFERQSRLALQRKNEELDGKNRELEVARNAAQKETEKANREADISHQTIEYFINLFRRPEPFLQSIREPTAKELLIQGAEMATSQGDSPLLQVRIWGGIAKALKRMSLSEEAAKYFELARDTAVEVLGPDHDETLDMRFQTGIALTNSRRYDEARACLVEVLESYERRDVHPAKQLDSKRWLANIQIRKEEYEEGIAAFRAALGDFTPILGEGHDCVQGTRYSLSRALVGSGQYVEAESLLRDCLRYYQDINPSPTFALAIRAVLVEIFTLTNRFDSAESEVRTLIDDWEESFPDELGKVAAQRHYATLLEKVGRLEEARELLHQSYEELCVKVGPYDHSTVETLKRHSKLMRRTGKKEEAYQRMESHKENALAALPYSDAVAIRYLCEFGVAAVDTKRYESAEEAFRECLDRLEAGDASEQDDVDYVINHSNLAEALIGQKRFEEAGEILRDMIPVGRELLGTQNRLYIFMHDQMAYICERLKRFEEAIEYLEEAIALGAGMPDDIKKWNRRLKRCKRKFERQQGGS